MDNNNNEKNTKRKMTVGEIIRMIIAIIACLISLAAFTLAFMFGSLPQNLQMLPFIMLAVAIIILLVLKTTGKNGKYADKLGSELEELSLESADIADAAAITENATEETDNVADCNKQNTSSETPTDSGAEPIHNNSEDTLSVSAEANILDDATSEEIDKSQKKQPLKLKKSPPIKKL